MPSNQLKRQTCGGGGQHWSTLGRTPGMAPGDPPDSTAERAALKGPLSSCENCQRPVPTHPRGTSLTGGNTWEQTKSELATQSKASQPAWRPQNLPGSILSAGQGLGSAPIRMETRTPHLLVKFLTQLVSGRGITSNPPRQSD